MKILFLDTETGGLNEFKHSLLTIGMVILEDGQITDKKEILICEEQYEYEEEGMRINGIDLDELRKKGISEIEAIQEINQFCTKHFDTERVILAGHNIKFDISFLKQLYFKNHVEFDTRFHHKTIDTVSIIKFLKLQGKLETESFDTLLETYHININRRHTALDDAQATAMLFQQLLQIDEIS